MLILRIVHLCRKKLPIRPTGDGSSNGR
jgi:hypothetical protein